MTPEPRPFPAKYRGLCGLCGRPISPGQIVVRTRAGGYRHAEHSGQTDRPFQQKERTSRT